MKEAYFVLCTKLNPFVDVMQQEVARVKKRETLFTDIARNRQIMCIFASKR